MEIDEDFQLGKFETRDTFFFPLQYVYWQIDISSKTVNARVGLEFTVQNYSDLILLAQFYPELLHKATD